MGEASRLLSREQQEQHKSYGSLHRTSSLSINHRYHEAHNHVEGRDARYAGRDEDDVDSVSTCTPTWRDRLQIPLLCYVRIMEPVSYYSIFPYIAQMTRHNGNLPASDIGFYTGLFESLFSAVQAMLLILWGSMADRVGYKRMLVCCLAGMTVTPVLFGLSTNLWQMAVFRSLNGAFAGSNIILRTMLMHRCTTSDTQVRAFSLYTFADNCALFIGPLMGGALANPVTQYPGIFKGSALFETFPYLLPGIVGGACCASAALITIFFLDDAETPTSKRKEYTSTGVMDHNDNGEDEEAILSKASKPTISRIMKAPGIVTLLFMLMSVKLLVSSMAAVSTTALDAPIKEGGMGYTSRQIALTITAQGAAEMIWLLMLFPLLHRHIGTKGILYICTVMFVGVFASYIFMSTSLRYDGLLTGRAWHWVAWGGVVLFGSGVLMAGTSGQIALQNLSPDQRALGTLNAVAETCTSIVRTIAPAASTTLFAVGLGTQALDGYLVWVVLIGISPMLLFAAKWLPRSIDSFGVK